MKHQHGYSLVEAMLVLFIGLVVIASFMQLMVGASFQTKFQENMALAQENGRYSLYYLSKKIRMAGYSSTANGVKPIPFFRTNCSTLGRDSLCTLDGGSLNSDQIAIQYQPLNGKDCANNNVPADKFTVDVYWQGPDNISGRGVDAILCRGFDPVTNRPRGTEKALIHGVEMLQVLYGIDEHGGIGSLDRYHNANSVTNWREVRSVQIGVIVNSGIKDIRGFDKRTRNFEVLDTKNITYTDDIPRYVYTTTIKLNNSGL